MSGPGSSLHLHITLPLHPDMDAFARRWNHPDMWTIGRFRLRPEDFGRQVCVINVRSF